MLHDSYSRKHSYLRVSLTDKCNLRCRYCMPPGGIDWLRHDQVLRNEEFVRLVRIFVSMGVTKVRFTGGEPLVRKGFIEITRETRRLFPELNLCLTTNGVLLERFLDDLADLRVRNINISLDTLSRKRYADITTVDAFDRVMAAIDGASGMNSFSVKVNAVLFKETLDELGDFLDFAAEKNVILRFIERMPFTDSRGDYSFLSSDVLIDALAGLGELRRDNSIDTSVAMMYTVLRQGREVKIGVIPPMTHKFCSSCNRLRLMSNGRMRTCLYDDEGADLLEPLRSGAADDELAGIIMKAIRKKKEGHSIECLSEDGGCQALSAHSMSRIGG